MNELVTLHLVKALLPKFSLVKRNGLALVENRVSLPVLNDFSTGCATGTKRSALKGYPFSTPPRGQTCGRAAEDL